MRRANNEAARFQTWNGRAVSFRRSIASFPPSPFSCTLDMMSFATSIVLLSVVCSAYSSAIAEPLPDATTQCKISVQVNLHASRVHISRIPAHYLRSVGRRPPATTPTIMLKFEHAQLNMTLDDVAFPVDHPSRILQMKTSKTAEREVMALLFWRKRQLAANTFPFLRMKVLVKYHPLNDVDV
uniref:Major sperm protein n=1 Tax=Ascaris lumbricoides TaxID=6252 RepID=A0A0M3HRS7_ASCLU